MRSPSDVIARLQADIYNAVNHTQLDASAFYNRALASIEALADKGYVVVPRKPTEAMHNAARDWSIKKYDKPIGSDASAGCWAAMIEAASSEVLS